MELSGDESLGWKREDQHESRVKEFVGCSATE
jgi:hypothetical protein